MPFQISSLGLNHPKQMHPFQTLSQEALLLALTEYYEKYRKMIESGGEEDDFITCKFSLEGILNELNTRRGNTQPLFNSDDLNTDIDREDFNFNRIDS